MGLAALEIGDKRQRGVVTMQGVVKAQLVKLLALMDKKALVHSQKAFNPGAYAKLFLNFAKQARRGVLASLNPSAGQGKVVVAAMNQNLIVMAQNTRYPEVKANIPKVNANHIAAFLRKKRNTKVKTLNNQLKRLKAEEEKPIT